MAYYNSVGTPRFYINIVEWLNKTTGYVPSEMNYGATMEHLYTLPVNPKPMGGITGITGGIVIGEPSMPPNLLNEKSFQIILGHDLKTHGSAVLTFNHYDDTLFSQNGDYINSYYGNNDSYDGWSLTTFNCGGTDNWKVHLSINTETNVINVGSIIIGTYFEMPHSPDLSLTLSYETGTKTIETRGGASLSNTFWQPPMWGNLGAWEFKNPEVDTPPQVLAHSSRRTWDLSFSYIDKEDSFPKYNALNRYSDPDLSGTAQDDTNDQTLWDSDDFFSQVWNRVGTSLPFVFQPNKDTPEMAICKFDQKSFSYKQVANGVYNVEMKIREVW